MHLERRVGAFDRGLGRVQLGHRRLGGVRLSAVLEVPGAPHQHPRRVGLHGDVGEHLLDELEARDRTAELLTLLGVLDRGI